MRPRFVGILLCCSPCLAQSGEEGGNTGPVPSQPSYAVRDGVVRRIIHLPGGSQREETLSGPEVLRLRRAGQIPPLDGRGLFDLQVLPKPQKFQLGRPAQLHLVLEPRQNYLCPQPSALQARLIQAGKQLRLGRPTLIQDPRAHQRGILQYDIPLQLQQRPVEDQLILEVELEIANRQGGTLGIFAQRKAVALHFSKPRSSSPSSGMGAPARTPNTPSPNTGEAPVPAPLGTRPQRRGPDPGTGALPPQPGPPSGDAPPRGNTPAPAFGLSSFFVLGLALLVVLLLLGRRR